MLDLKLIEQNRCPGHGCGRDYFRNGTGYDYGITCNKCGWTVPIAQYREIMGKFIREKFTNPVEPEEEESPEVNTN